MIYLGTPGCRQGPHPSSNENMKIKSTIVFFLLLTFVSAARLIPQFTNWHNVEASSSDIVVVKCDNVMPPEPTINGPASDFSVEVLTVLKGTTNTASARLWTDYKLHKGEIYLVFGRFENGIYLAFEEYRVIPLGEKFSTSLITNKPLEEQIRTLFKVRIDRLNDQMQSARAEKERLEEGLTRYNLDDVK